MRARVGGHHHRGPNIRDDSAAINLQASQGSLPNPHQPLPRTLTRTYRGNPNATVEAMRGDAAQLESRGYVPISQAYSPGQYGCGAFLVALVLFVVPIGILIFLYMLIVKPAGTLTVVYELWHPSPPTPDPERAIGVTDVQARLARLDQLRESRTITEAEHTSRRAEIIKDL